MMITIPSMKIDQNYYCFACGAKGDVIDFTSRLFGISQFEAAQKLITDFGLPIRSEKEDTCTGGSPRTGHPQWYKVGIIFL